MKNMENTNTKAGASKKARLGIIIALIIALAGICGAVAASYNNELRVHHHMTSGVVDIALEAPQGQTDYDIAASIPRQYTLTSKGEPCYIRLKASMQPVGQDFASPLVSMNGDWVKGKDGYWYYPEIVNEGDKLVYKSDFSLPDEPKWQNLVTNDNKVIHLVENIKAEAIQAKHFTPDYDADNPWGDEEIMAYEEIAQGGE